MTSVDRPRLVARISRSLCQKGCPRLQMTLIVVATGVAGFLSSMLLLHLGMVKMWERYPLAVVISYGVFLLLLKLWVVYQRRCVARDLLDASDLDPTDFLSSGGSMASTAQSSGSDSWTDLLPDWDVDEWVAVLVLLVALVAAITASVFIVLSAPSLLGEVLLDAVLMAGLRKKMAGVAEQHWVWGAVRRSAVAVVVVALVFSLAGAAIQHIKPGATSIGGVLHAERGELPDWSEARLR